MRMRLPTLYAEEPTTRMPYYIISCDELLVLYTWKSPAIQRFVVYWWGITFA